MKVENAGQVSMALCGAGRSRLKIADLHIGLRDGCADRSGCLACVMRVSGPERSSHQLICSYSTSILRSKLVNCVSAKLWIYSDRCDI